ncbi:MAG: glycosyltransferase [Bacteroidales bacterium]|nr:glycosyltransferase [Bacteroidales bacterium]
MILSDHPVHIILLVLFVIMATIQAWYWLAYYRKPAFFENEAVESREALPPLSVIICARNEAENLRRFLPAVLKQDYPSYEVIVVNDCSEDNTYDVLGDLMKVYPHLKVSSIQKDPGFTHAKKLAMLIGIKASSNDILVFTDADCHPVSDRWLRAVAQTWSEKTEIVIGYGGMAAEKGLLNKFIRHETLIIAMQYFGMAMAGVPYMGVGRNLSYRRSFFFARGGFGPFSHLMSGDDDLFVNRNATPDNLSLMLSPDSFTLSVAPGSFSEWAKQRKRHFTTAVHYKGADKIRLLIEPLSRVCYYGLLIAMLVMLASWPVVLLIALARLVMRSVILKRAGDTFSEKGLWYFSLFFDILSPVVNSFFYLTGKRKGKGREVWK